MQNRKVEVYSLVWIERKTASNYFGYTSLPQRDYASLFGVMVIVVAVVMMKAAIMVAMVTVVTVGGGEHTGDGGLSHQSLSYLRHYHWWFILFLNVTLLCKISI